MTIKKSFHLLTFLILFNGIYPYTAFTADLSNISVYNNAQLNMFVTARRTLCGPASTSRAIPFGNVWQSFPILVHSTYLIYFDKGSYLSCHYYTNTGVPTSAINKYIYTNTTDVNQLLSLVKGVIMKANSGTIAWSGPYSSNVHIDNAVQHNRQCPDPPLPNECSLPSDSVLTNALHLEISSHKISDYQSYLSGGAAQNTDVNSNYLFIASNNVENSFYRLYQHNLTSMDFPINKVKLCYYDMGTNAQISNNSQTTLTLSVNGTSIAQEKNVHRTVVARQVCLTGSDTFAGSAIDNLIKTKASSFNNREIRIKIAEKITMGDVSRTSTKYIMLYNLVHFNPS